tara:strand:+ start:459 stop:626 length:168 start_codon:yes stop_codon:yes gene_type:complete
MTQHTYNVQCLSVAELISMDNDGLLEIDGEINYFGRLYNFLLNDEKIKKILSREG